MSRAVAVLISGGGSNLQALIESCALPDSAARIVLVISNRPDAYGLVRAREAGIPTAVVDHRKFIDRFDFESNIDALLRQAGVELVCLAGFMRVLTPHFVDAWRDRTLNIHPSLLPAFPGLHTHARALDAGVRLAGCTVHLVRSEVDIGPILMQAAVPVLEDDDDASLAARVLEVEHQAYPRALQLLARGDLVIEGEQVRPADPIVPPARLLLHPLLRS
ncbi:phosphoribosylglycinamide formyltransferase-1 [Arboricoccus pini]|uniref:Phosphoribosylglycinamide formyltransferase n=1 Tax=Arboricoccus pini TaxID=1963835 RepID=A0A212Q828_9PROT|nr:phosphoribosylglycinamide formyltransferase [Arboricoccus pini]SNB55493.1 phosphoribosylglycinamide formyltransferase-1 [Arboricoccus pini]